MVEEKITEETTEAKEVVAEENQPQEQKKEEAKKGPQQSDQKANKKGSFEKKKRPPRRKRGRRGAPEKEKEFMEEVLQIDRVTRVVKGGRRLRFRATVIIGDRKGRVGVGIGKSAEVVGGIQKAIQKAKKQLIRINIENGTIPHQVKIKHKSSRLLLMPGREGSGIIAGGATRKICDLAGIENIVAKTIGTSNRLVNAQATIKALEALQVKPSPKKVENKKPNNKNTPAKSAKKETKTAEKAG